MGVREVLRRLAAALRSGPEELDIGIYGAPNVGKTTLANRIAQDWEAEEFGQVSEVPHETRESVRREVAIEVGSTTVKFNIVDTPGIATKVDYRKFLEYGLDVQEAKQRAKEATRGVVEAIKLLKDIDGALVVIDSTKDPLSQVNVTLIGNLEANDVPFLVVANKIDLEEADPEAVRKAFSEYPVVAVSAKTGENMAKLYEAMVREFTS
ncbi:GTP-binding protein [Methanopyrus kandleri]|uniref:Small, Ras-like GTPase n=1 Tax=Methanopyrus kandleri (strain AV19 / DSM 6324 / JCM 9639 / NBRC 100938) TaxID=190192 RepID=Q8TYX7_METKA|nr:GTP-binding protein [Methanopyrus kandleri]AAM01381.1 Small, Ras-like GTPase [Methanopyrus kandleri AV19]